MSVLTQDEALCIGQDSETGGWTCMFNLEKHFWSDLHSQMVGTVGTVISGDLDSVHSDDSWETSLKSVKPTTCL